ncbi:MAG TPA: GAF domain-containing protein [Roseiflexaceae bacterium]|nr:GAF domain-containing protein [Roseiflexaceae bacterium]
MATILIVDDHPTNRAFLVTLLGYVGHQLLEAADGAEALEVVRASHPDLVIADVLMPTMDGYEFVRRLRAEPAIAHTRVIFYTAMYLEHEAQALARDCGVEHVLLKPAPPDFILQTVASVLAQVPLAPAPAPAAPPADSFDRAHTRLLTNKLAAKVDELTAVNDRLAALLELSRRLATERDPDKLLQTCCDAAREIVGATYAALDVRAADQPLAHRVHTSGVDAEATSWLSAAPSGGGIFDQLLAVEAPEGGPGISVQALAGDLRPKDVLLAVPVASATWLYGTLYLADKLGADSFSDEDRQVATTLASQLAVAYENAQRYDALQRHAVAADRELHERKRAAERQATQFAVTRIIAEAENRYDAIPALLEAICRGTAWDLGECWRVDAESNLLRWENDWRISSLDGSAFVTTSQVATFARGSGIPGRVWASGRPEWVADIAATTSPRAALALEAGFHSTFAFPILGDTEVLGVMVFFCRQPRQPDLDLLTTVSDIGSQIGQFFERAQAEERLWQYTQRLRTLHVIDQAILAAQSPQAIAQAALRYMRELAPCRASSVAVFDHVAHEAIILASEASMALPFGPGAHVPLDTFISLSILKHDQPFIMEDLQALAAPTLLNQQALKDGIRSYLSVPISSQQTLIGVLNLFSDRPRAFSPDLIDVAREVGSQLAVALQNAQLFEQVRIGREHLRHLSRQLVRAQEDERRHIARELHDEVGQSLTAALLNLQVLGSLTDPSDVPARLDDSMSLIDRVLQQVRTLSLDLRPALLDDLGLAPALNWLLDRQAKRAGFVAQFHAHPGVGRLSAELETTCFRVAQEALTNIVRYARAGHVSVELGRSATELWLSVRDDGVGFDVAAERERAARGQSSGLLGMQERVDLLGGHMRIESTPGLGSMIYVRLPLRPPSSDAPEHARSGQP